MLSLEKERRIKVSQQEIRDRLRQDMDEEFTRRQAFLSERMEIEAEQAFQRQVRDLESELRLDMEQQLGNEEDLQKQRIQEGLDERLAERFP